jgi:hypothetical protein
MNLHVAHAIERSSRRPVPIARVLGACVAVLVGCHGTVEATPPAADTGIDRAPLPGRVDVLTQHNDVTRSGQNVNETVLNTSNVSSKSFGKLFSVPADGLVFAQPLVVSNYIVAGKVHDVLLVATAHNSVYAYDANTVGDPLWHVDLGPTVPAAIIAGGTGLANIPVELGILSTPVIDRTNGIVYVTDTTYVNGTQAQWLHALSLATGQDEPGSPIAMTASVPVPGDSDDTVVLDTPHHAQRPGLLLVNGKVYVAFGSHNDWPTFHGWILGYQYDVAAGTLTQTDVFCTTPDGKSGGIWQSGQGLVSDGSSIYAVLGNGTVTAQNGGASYGESFLKLSLDLKVQDWFAPVDYATFSVHDVDIGSGGPVLLPTASAPLVATASKIGIMYVVDSANMGHLGTTSDTNLEEFQAVQRFWGAPVVWTASGDPRLYIWGTADPVQEYVLSNGRLGTTSVATSTNPVVNIPSVGYQDPVGNLAVSSNESEAGTGIVWAVQPLSSPATTPVAGRFYALDALTLKTLWDSMAVPARDSFGNFAKFVPPTVANGKVYLATFSHSVVVYGLLGSDAAK